MSPGEIYAWIWIGYLIAVFFIVIGVILWAKRNGQFSKQTRASRLPLEIDEPTKSQKNENHVSRSA